jgi:hypothetical protein
VRKYLAISILSVVCILAVLQIFSWITTATIPAAKAVSTGGGITDQTPTPAQKPLEPSEILQIAADRPMTVPTGATAITPPVTESSIRAYVTSNNMGGGVAAKNVQVEFIQFTTIGELRKLISDPFLTSFPEDMSVAHVRVNGEFTFGDADEKQHTYLSGFRVFSLETGNELMGGATP